MCNLCDRFVPKTLDPCLRRDDGKRNVDDGKRSGDDGRGSYP